MACQDCTSLLRCLPRPLKGNSHYFAGIWLLCRMGLNACQRCIYFRLHHVFCYPVFFGICLLSVSLHHPTTKHKSKLCKSLGSLLFARDNKLTVLCVYTCSPVVATLCTKCIYMRPTHTKSYVSTLCDHLII